MVTLYIRLNPISYKSEFKWTLNLSLLLQYFCYECKLFDDEDKAQFHCDGCGICRIGGRENFFHCATCNMCLPTHLEGKHKVIDKLLPPTSCII